MTAASKRVMLGEVTGAHGIKGDVVVRSYTGQPAAIAAYGPLEDEHGQRRLELSVRRVTDKGVIAHITGIDDRNGAEALKGTRLFVAREALPDTAEDEFYHADLIGLEAVDTEGTVLGPIVAVVNYGAGDLIEIRRAGRAATDLVPFTAAFVPNVNLAAGRVVVSLPVVVEGDDEGAGSAEG